MLTDPPPRRSLLHLRLHARPAWMQAVCKPKMGDTYVTPILFTKGDHAGVFLPITFLFVHVAKRFTRRELQLTFPMAEPPPRTSARIAGAEVLKEIVCTAARQVKQLRKGAIASPQWHHAPPSLTCRLHSAPVNRHASCIPSVTSWYMCHPA